MCGLNQLLVGTLNYGGILNSPYEFYSDDLEEEIRISEKVKALIPQYFPDYNPETVSWKIGKIDQKIQR